MKRCGLLPVLGLLLLGAQCDRSIRPATPPPGWVIPLVAPDSSGNELEVQEIAFQPSGLAVSGRFSGPAGRGFFVGLLSLQGLWREYHPVTAAVPGIARVVPVENGYLAYAFHLDFSCAVYVLARDGTLRDSLVVQDPEGYDCTVSHALPLENGFLVTGTSLLRADSFMAFLAYLEETPEGYRQRWFHRFMRGDHARNWGGILLGSPEGPALLGLTASDTSTLYDSLWIVKLTSTGQALAETTLPYTLESDIIPGTGGFLVLGPLPRRSLQYFDLSGFRILWQREDVPYLQVDIAPTGAFAGAVARDSLRLRYVQLDLRTGAETASRDLWHGVGSAFLLRTGPQGFAVTFPSPGYDTTYLAYVPYGGALPSLPGRTTVAADPSPCAPRHFSFQPHRTLWRNAIFEVYGNALNHTTGNGREERCSGIFGN